MFKDFVIQNNQIFIREHLLLKRLSYEMTTSNHKNNFLFQPDFDRLNNSCSYEVISVYILN